MDEFNAYLSEALRVRRSIQVYYELFGTIESVSVLAPKSIELYIVLQRSMHDEILISLSRLFDGEGYKNKKVSCEYLSQRNLVRKYESSLDEDLIEIKNKTTKLWQDLKIKEYRDCKLAHNDKESICDPEELLQHNFSYGSAKGLIEASIDLILGLKAKKGKSRISVILKNKYENVGYKFINSIK